ncbi:Adaptive-response sensory-kinase SasA [subsurface metagenome]
MLLQEYRVIRESAVAEAEEHKKAKKALNSSEKLYKLITENAKDLIALHSIPKLNYLYLNPSTEKVLGYSKEELLGKSAIGLIHPKDRLRVLKAVIKGIIRGEGSEEFRYRKKDGSYIWVEVTGKLTKGEQGQPAGLIFSRDITKRKKIEEELHRYKKHLEEQVHERTIELTTANEQLRRDIIERKNAAEQRIQLEQQLQQSKKLESIGTLAAGIAHEINTPLQFIGDNSRFLSEIIEKLLTLINTYRNLLSECEHGEKTNNAIKKAKESEQTVDLEYITEEIPKAISQTQEGLSRVTKIVNAMKDFSHMDTDEKIEANINKAIENTITVSRNEWKYVAEMKTDLTPSLPPIHCFLGDINQVVMNLIVNAAHAIANVVGDGSKDKGEITITTRHENNSVIITVADTGTGIPENIRDKIFDPFFTTKKIGKGTGQGLSMAYASIVEKHKGKLIFDTKLGKGTTFIIELPLKKK